MINLDCPLKKHTKSKSLEKYFLHYEFYFRMHFMQCIEVHVFCFSFTMIGLKTGMAVMSGPLLPPCVERKYLHPEK